jgi:8-oxo-dGTP pyrophosphatase MutT (NUDIX family)
LNASFALRASAIVIRQGRVLLHRTIKDAYWALPGGHVESGETSEQTVLRELAEELGVQRAQIGRLVWIIENRFIDRGRHFQEIGFVYQVDLPADECPVCDEEFVGAQAGIRLRWFGLGEIARIDLRPPFLRRSLASLPNGIEHVQLDETAR